VREPCWHQGTTRCCIADCGSCRTARRGRALHQTLGRRRRRAPAREGHTNDRAFAINDGDEYNAYDACEDCDDPESLSESLYCDEKEDAAYFAKAEIQDLEDIFAANIGGSGYDAPPDILLCDEPAARHQAPVTKTGLLGLGVAATAILLCGARQLR